jgi:UPF0755 protein
MSQVDDPWAAEGEWGTDTEWGDEPVVRRTSNVPSASVQSEPVETTSVESFSSQSFPDTSATARPARSTRGSAAPATPARPPNTEAPETAKVPRRARRRSEPQPPKSQPLAPTPPKRQRDVLQEDFPPPRRGRAFLGFLLTLAIIAAGALAGLRWYQNQLDPPGPPREAITVVIPNNTSTARIGRILHSAGVLGNPTVFRYWVQLRGKGGFEAGQYEFRGNSSFESVLSTLQDGPAVPDEQKLTIPEGFRLSQIAGRIGEKLSGRSANAFLAAIDKGQIRSAYQPSGVSSLEGFLFPETYTFAMNDDEGVIAARMVETFDGVADQVGLANAQDVVGVSPYDALIVASLVEREAKKDDERAKIARVVYNRLKADMYLQIDAGIIYALNNGTTRLFEDDLKLDSPYNSYVHKGLPPTPIASPGKASIEAALHPEEGTWLYYVVTSADGSSSFATTYKEHRKNIKIAEKNGLR